MKLDLHVIKKIKGMAMEGIYGKLLHIYNNNGELILHCSKPLIRFQTSHVNMDERFWLFEWEELETGENILILNEQGEPDSLEYEVIDSLNEKYLIPASSYSTSKNLIKKVWGYGFSELKEEKLTSVVLELEDSFIHIEASPAIEIRITKEKPNIHWTLLVSS
ncbi:hypothetical protein RGU12_20355 [Fredinandcohnia sp. QZ13]|uniref:hypothetical protein n=1 Tax=Fredinandcohnia sp. QZ13 TaxID=3073144 RepID=UPI0028530649|nr:hypothetical protein [Fredinandcohnia sp. QZ13]MDR4889850.1 hypothetical protein [Fredinandcohnia sp. QZ13]